MTDYVTRVQHVTITIPAGSLSAFETIDEIDPNKIIIQDGSFSSDYTGSFGGGQTHTRIEITNSTTITLVRGVADATYSTSRSFVIIEGTDDLIDSVSYGSMTLTGGTGSDTIASVDVDNSEVFILGATTTATNVATAQSIPAVELASSTNVAGYVNNAGATFTLDYMLVRFNSAAIESIQRFSDSYANSNTTDNKTLPTSVTVGNVMLVNNGQVTANFNAIRRFDITSPSNIQFKRTNTNTTSTTPYYSVINFVSGVITSRQSGNIPLTGTASDDDGITSTTLGACSYLGQSWQVISTFDGLAAAFPSVTLTNPALVTASKGAAGVDDIVVPAYQVLDFGTAGGGFQPAWARNANQLIGV